ncbi:MAG: hypothetical protein IKX44_10060 [Prevotella sp.]|nr:hypothetical protein [Prevotella sp.]
MYGRKFTSKSNGNSVFLPAAGYRYGSGLYDQTSYGDYCRYFGFPVRPVLRN